LRRIFCRFRAPPHGPPRRPPPPPPTPPHPLSPTPPPPGLLFSSLRWRLHIAAPGLKPSDASGLLSQGGSRERYSLDECAALRAAGGDIVKIVESGLKTFLQGRSAFWSSPIFDPARQERRQALKDALRQGRRACANQGHEFSWSNELPGRGIDRPLHSDFFIYFAYFFSCNTLSSSYSVHFIQSSSDRQAHPGEGTHRPLIFRSVITTTIDRLPGADIVAARRPRRHDLSRGRRRAACIARAVQSRPQGVSRRPRRHVSCSAKRE